MEEIEESSRMYEADGALHLSCWLLSYEATIPENSSVTFVVNRKHLVSVRYSDHHSFRLFSSPASASSRRSSTRSTTCSSNCST